MCHYRYLWFSSLLFCALLLASCAAGKKAEKPRSVPVVTASVVKRAVPVEITAIGNVEAFSTVSIKPQVSGIITAVHFKEGDYVRRGDLLFTIDSRPYQEAYIRSRSEMESAVAAARESEGNYQKAIAQQKQAEANLQKARAQVNQAQANLEKDQAQAKNADAVSARYEQLLAKGFATHEQADLFHANAEAFRATLKADLQAIENAKADIRAGAANIENARAGVRQSAANVENMKARIRSSKALMGTASIDLGYCTIRSPIDGRTGSLLIHEGNLVTAGNAVPMVVVNCICPIYVDCAVPERYLGEIKRHNEEKKLAVKVSFQDPSIAPETGLVSFIDNAVDTTTGTIRIKAVFNNKKRMLWPGQFVTAVIRLATLRDALVLPTRAVLTGQKGDYVFVAGREKKAEFRTVKTGLIQGETTVIERGLYEGDEVVTDGQLRLIDGTLLEIRPSQQEGPEPKGPRS